MTFVKTRPTKALLRFGPATSEQIPFLQTCVGLSSEKKFPTQHVLVFFTRAIFWLDLLQGHIFAFPLYGIFESQVLMEKPCLSSNFFWPKLLQILGLAPSDQVPFLKMCLGLSTEKNFPNNMSWYRSPEQFSNLIFHRGTSSLSFNMVFWMPGIDGKPLTFVKIYLTKASTRFGPCFFWAICIPANAFGIEFWK